MVEVTPNFLSIKGIFSNDGGFDYVFDYLSISAKPIAAYVFIRDDFEQRLRDVPFGARMAVPV